MRVSRGRTAAGVLVAAAAAALAGAGPAAAGSEVTLGARGVEGIAMRAAKQWGDARPRDIRYASGPLEAAVKLIAPGSLSNPSMSPNGPEAEGGARSEVDLVAVWGRFTANVPVRHGGKPPTGKVMELIVDAHSGFVEMRSLQDRLPVPLSRLGRVKDLHRGIGGSPRRSR